MIATDLPAIMINHIDPHKIPEMHPKMVEVLEQHDVFSRRDEETGEWIIQGHDHSNQSKKSTGKRKARSIQQDITPPGRITGVLIKAPFDVIQALPLTDMKHRNSPKMKWLFYWMLICLPKDRIREESMEYLLQLYHFDEPEVIDIMKGVFIMMMTRIEDIQLLFSCGQFPPYSFISISHFELITVCLGRISDSQEVNEETETVKQRRDYVSGFSPFCLKYQTQAIKSAQFVSQICSMVEKGGVHGLFEKICAEQKEIFDRQNRIKSTIDLSTMKPLDHVPFGFNPDDFDSFPEDTPENMEQDG